MRTQKPDILIWRRCIRVGLYPRLTQQTFTSIASLTANRHMSALKWQCYCCFAEDEKTKNTEKSRQTAVKSFLPTRKLACFGGVMHPS
uniref:Secreted protein n=1 Tax=Panagrellus redivivus TaxID=6233 RepID=A0A7E4W7A2_PANRE